MRRFNSERASGDSAAYHIESQANSLEIHRNGLRDVLNVNTSSEDSDELMSETGQLIQAKLSMYEAYLKNEEGFSIDAEDFLIELLDRNTETVFMVLYDEPSNSTQLVQQRVVSFDLLSNSLGLLDHYNVNGIYLDQAIAQKAAKEWNEGAVKNDSSDYVHYSNDYFDDKYEDALYRELMESRRDLTQDDYAI